MPRRRLPFALLAPVALVVLVATLGVLQYRWVGQVSERERDQLRQSLDRRAGEFAADFDAEITRAYQAFRPGLAFSPASSADRFAKQYDEWHASARFPGFVKHAYFAAVSDNGIVLHRWSAAARQFETIEWPEALLPARARLLTAKTGTSSIPGATMVSLSVSPVLPHIPAILIPEMNPIEAERRVETAPAPPPASGAVTATGTVVNVMVNMRGGPSHAILELDRDYIESTMLPALVDRHFPAGDADRFRVAITTGRADPAFTRGLPAGQTLDLASADAVTGFFGMRMEMFRAVTTSAPVAAVRSLRPSAPAAMGWTSQDTPEQEKRAAEAASRVSMFITENPSGVASPVRALPASWMLLLQHSAGSLDAAVEQARRRNLMLSFGILSVLAASAGLVMMNARRAERLAAQQMDFVATVSHELRTPLAVIRSAAQNLSAGVVHDSSQAKRYGDLIETEGRRLTDMVEQVLEYAGLSDARRRPSAAPVDAGALVRDVATAVASLPEAAGVDVSVTVDPDLPPVLVEADGIRRALHNLAGNALKYAADGRHVGLGVSRGTGADNGFVRLTVSDRGPGIPAEELPRIFEPFFRGRHAQDRQIRGNGLGLSLVKRIAEAHGGRVTVASTAGQGSTFTLYLPIAAGAATAAAHQAGAAGFGEPATSRGHQS